jgi:predicted RNA binding protein YcfA (HicA-like mRNA interferase family)
VIRRTKVAAKAKGLDYSEPRQRGNHRQVRVGVCVTTVQMDRRDIPIGTLRKIERDLAQCLGARWLR